MDHPSPKPWCIGDTLISWVVLCAVWCPILAGTRAAFGDEALQDGTERMGRLIDGHRIKTIRENREKRIEFRNNLRRQVTKVVGTVAGWFGLPGRVIEAIVGAAVALFGLCCLGLFVVVFSVCAWAVVSLFRRPA